MDRDRTPGRGIGGAALKFGIAGVVGFGALATGLLLSRQGRHLVKEAWEGRRRTRLEDRVLAALWADAVLGHRHIDVEEVADGTVAMTGIILGDQERALCMSVAGRVPGVQHVVDRLAVRSPGPGRRMLRARRTADDDRNPVEDAR
jgi:hypothetical protein